MSDIKQGEKVSHVLQLSDRKTLGINGVIEVVSFDDCSIVLKTVCGELVIDGQGLRISTLDTSKGIVAIDGNVQSLTYYDQNPNERRGRIGKLLK